MSNKPRPPRLAAQRAEYYVDVIAKQEEETRNELYSIAQFQERSAHIEKLPQKIVCLKLKSEEGVQFLRSLAEDDPEIAEPVCPYLTLRFHSDDAKERFREVVNRPVVIKNDLGVNQEDDNADVEATYPFVNEGEEHEVAPSHKLFNCMDQSFHNDSPSFPTSWKTPRARRRRSSSVPTSGKLTRPRLGQYVPPSGQVIYHPPTQKSVSLAWSQLKQMSQLPRNNARGVLENVHLHLPWTPSLASNKALLSPPTENEEQVPETSSATPIVSNTGFSNSPEQHVLAWPERIQLWPNNAMESLQTPSVSDTVRIDIEKHEQGAPFNFMSLPARNLPEHTSYRVGPYLHQRLMKYQKPPNGWEGCIGQPYNTDHSDPRFWSAPSIQDQDDVWRALDPTVRQFWEITGEIFTRDQATFLPFGYDSTYVQMHHKFSQWCFATLGMNHRWTVGGKVVHRLFKLERWYGLLEDYEFAPNWPNHRRDFNGRIVQNPDCFACEQCLNLDVFCHGHREDLRSCCLPCVVSGRRCSKRL